MKLKLVSIKSRHDITKSALNKVFNGVVLNNTSMSFTNSENDYEYLRTSSVKKITVETLNSVYEFERLSDENEKK